MSANVLAKAAGIASDAAKVRPSPRSQPAHAAAHTGMSARRARSRQGAALALTRIARVPQDDAAAAADKRVTAKPTEGEALLPAEQDDNSSPTRPSPRVLRHPDICPVQEHLDLHRRARRDLLDIASSLLGQEAALPRRVSER